MLAILIIPDAKQKSVLTSVPANAVVKAGSVNPKITAMQIVVYVFPIKDVFLTANKKRAVLLICYVFVMILKVVIVALRNVMPMAVA